MQRVLATALALGGLLTSGSVVAQFRKPQDAVEYRMGAFAVMEHHFFRIGAMVRGKVPYDADAAAADANIVLTLSKLPFTAFLPGTGETERGGAKANIWTENDKFQAAAKKMQDAAAQLDAAAKAQDLGQLKSAYGATAQACKACHDHFRNE